MRPRDRDAVMRSRWKRDNLVEKFQQKIVKETQLVAKKTGVNPWLVLGMLP